MAAATINTTHPQLSVIYGDTAKDISALTGAWSPVALEYNQGMNIFTYISKNHVVPFHC